jgi:hypothetical protein
MSGACKTEGSTTRRHIAKRLPGIFDENNLFVSTFVPAWRMRIAHPLIAADTNAAQFRATWLRSASTSIRRKGRALAGLIVWPTSI